MFIYMCIWQLLFDYMIVWNLLNIIVTSGAGPRAVGTERGRWSNW